MSVVVEEVAQEVVESLAAGKLVSRILSTIKISLDVKHLPFVVADCSGRGIADGSDCDCNPGYTGRNCELPVAG